MPLSVPHIALAARKREADELKRLRSRADLVGLTGLMIHVLQKERGASSLFLASSGMRFGAKREQLINESESVERLLVESIDAELEDSASSNARILSLMAWIMLGLQALPELRERITQRKLDGNESLTTFSSPGWASTASSAQVFGVSQPRSCSQPGMKKRGTMLPPTAEITRMATFERVCAWRRVRQADATSNARAEAAAAASNVVTAHDTRCPGRSTPCTSQATTKMMPTCTKP